MNMEGFFSFFANYGFYITAFIALILALFYQAYTTRRG